ncbi:YjdF family protein [Ruminococcus flavefaciens]|uniref:YjdF family protein n=1 Tax=Ruminococcus flavefaciens TaxID=1265 RepID=UPI000314A943|nr:YjdF family protein [Ruminococcus flavefaciens]
MDKTNGMLTVFFEEPFWVGVFERSEKGKLSAAKVIFGAEPKDREVFEFVLRHYYKLKFSPAVKVKTKQTADNPKRRQRNARKQLSTTGIGTKSQQALKLMQEQMKTERRQLTKAQREAEKQRQFELKQQKRREKHKGH